MILIIIVGIFTTTTYLPQQSNQQLSLSSQLVLSTIGFFDIYSDDITRSGERHSAAKPNFNLSPSNCPNKLAIYVHGAWANEREANEQYDRLKDSYADALKAIDPSSQPMPIVLYSCDSDTLVDIWVMDGISQRI